MPRFSLTARYGTYDVRMSPRRVWTPELKQEFVNMLREGVSKSRAAMALGTTWNSAKSAMRSDQEFADEVNGVLERLVDDVEGALYETAMKGNVEAQKFFLVNRAREEWSNRSQVEHVGAGGGPIAVAVAATEALRNVLMEGDTRGPALGYIDAQLAPPGARGALAEDRVSGELGGGDVER